MGRKKGQTSFKTDVPDEYTPGWLQRIDARTTIAKVLAGRIRAVEADLGGADALTYAQRSLISRAIFIEQHVINAEVAMAEGRPVDTAAWLAAVGQLQRLYTALGLKRVARDVPDIRQYLGAQYGDAEHN